MKKIIIIISIITSINIFGQIEPSVTFDPVTGYYVCKYQNEDGVQEVIFEPRTNIEPKINARIIFNADSSYYEYNYEVFNSATSIQRIYRVAIEYLSEISNINKPDSLWYSGFYSILPFVRWVNITNPTGFASENDGVAQGSKLSGFGFTSSGLPTIGKGYFYGNNMIPLAFPDEGHWKIYEIIDPLRKFPNNCIMRKTISPKAPLEPFVATDFTDTLKVYTDSSYPLGWIANEQTRDRYNNYLNTAKSYLEQGDSSTARTELQKVLTDCNTDSSTVLTSEAYALLYFNTEYLVNMLPESPAVEGLPVKLTDSQSNLLSGGTLQYYEGTWKDAIDNGNGTFVVQTYRTTISLKMNYLGGWQQFNNVIVGTDTVVFQTVNATVQLKDSQSSPTDGAVASFYAKSWQEISTTVNGETNIELLPRNYSFRMSYLGGSIDKKQNIGEESLVLFQTVNATVSLNDSQGNPLDGATAQFYAKSWQEIGTTVNGETNIELLQKEYSFRMTYGSIGNDKKQNIGNDPSVLFTTIPVTVSVKDNNGNAIVGAEVQYYSKTWNIIGNTDTSGEITLEMLPKNITFRVKYNSQTTDKQQDTAENSLVEFVIE